MLMFSFHMAQALGLMALGLGVGLIIWAARNDGRGVGAAKFFGYIIAIIAVINIACNTYSSFKYWKEGYFKAPMCKMMMEHKQQSNNNMMQDDM